MLPGPPTHRTIQCSAQSSPSVLSLGPHWTACHNLDGSMYKLLVEHGLDGLQVDCQAPGKARFRARQVRGQRLGENGGLEDIELWREVGLVGCRDSTRLGQLYCVSSSSSRSASSILQSPWCHDPAGRDQSNSLQSPKLRWHCRPVRHLYSIKVRSLQH